MVMSVQKWVLVVLWIAVARPLYADSEPLHLSAYITQGFAKTFLGEIDKERSDLSLTLYAIQMTAEVNESLKLRTEVEGHDGLTEEAILSPPPHTSLRPEIIVASAQYALTENLRLDVGLIKQPFSFYNEVRNVGIAYPFVTLPSLYQPVTGAMEENFRGAELHSDWYWGDVELEVLLYYGQMNLFSFFNEKAEFDMERFDFAEFKAETLPIKNLMGGQMTLDGLLDGLRFSAGGWTGWFYEGSQENRWESWVLGAEWETDWFMANAEWSRINDLGEAYYGFLGAKLPGDIMITGMIDRYSSDRSFMKLSTIRQWAVGAVWSVSPELAIKAETSWLEQILNIPNLFSMNNDQRKVSVSLSAALF